VREPVTGNGFIALVHEPSPRMAECEVTFKAREPIDLALVRAQHEGYSAMLRGAGAQVRELDVNRDYPDCVFIEDTAIVLDDVAILTSMGAASRRGEVEGIAPLLAEYRPIERITLPATIEGGDVLRVGRAIYVGSSSRTNAAGVEALRAIAARHGHRVVPVPVRGCLHFKSACTALPDGRLLLYAAWLDTSALESAPWVDVPAEEPDGANVTLVGDVVCAAAEFPRTVKLLDHLGFDVRTTPMSELAKAEGAVTCGSLIFRA
jgi:dimethylargininase